MGLMQPKSETVLFTDQLYAKIKAWENGVREVKELRGGEEGNIWNLQYVKEKEDEEKARQAKIREEERKKKQQQIAHTVRELLKRIARVEKVSARVKNQEKKFGRNITITPNTLFGL